MKELSEQQKSMNIKGEWIWRAAISIVVAVIGWFSKEYLNEQKEFNKGISVRVSALEMHQAAVSGNRFSAVDWLSAKTVLDAQLTNTDKRLTRLEDAFSALKEALPRMEAKMDKLAK